MLSFIFIWHTQMHTCIAFIWHIHMTDVRWHIHMADSDAYSYRIVRHIQTNFAYSDDKKHMQMTNSYSNGIFRFTWIWMWHINRCFHMKLTYSDGIFKCILVPHSDGILKLIWHIQMAYYIFRWQIQFHIHIAYSDLHSYSYGISTCAFILRRQIHMAYSIVHSYSDGRFRCMRA